MSPRLPRLVMSLATVTSLAVLACSSASPSGGAPAETAPDTTPADESAEEREDAGVVPAPRAPDACGAVARSLCKPANEGSVVRGIVRFDGSKVGAGAKLRVFLHHQVTLSGKESTFGGHPHAFDSFPLDLAKGEARFTIDLCLFGTAMWSEENCGFNVVVMIDDDGLNDPDRGSSALVPRKGKLVKMAPLDISCHEPSPCLELFADCTDGEACTTFTPPTKCTCAADACPSEDALCKM